MYNPKFRGPGPFKGQQILSKDFYHRGYLLTGQYAKLKEYGLAIYCREHPNDMPRGYVFPIMCDGMHNGKSMEDVPVEYLKSIFNSIPMTIVHLEACQSYYSPKRNRYYNEEEVDYTTH